ncbi:DUF1667 domain-containing protein [Candidatus Bipolaricaulota bacterium]|nr:DUF1667 domain-containing protein [Candidatus Bipolaricaulota bacterium]
MKKRLICISCPVGCELTVEVENGKVISVSGNRCPRGEAYAREEAVEPRRVLATSVKVLGGELPLVSVKTDRPIPKNLIPQIMELVKGLSVNAPVELGQVILENLLDTGAKLVATRAVPRLPQEPLNPGVRPAAGPP